MTLYESFLHAILESPDDDVPRLVFADWLEEHGQQERAEFIRTQCELVKLPEGHLHRTKLEARQQELLAQQEEEWLAPLRESINDWMFYRGMLGIGVDVEQFLAHAEALTRSPWVHYIDIVDHAVGRTRIEALFASPFLARVTFLNLAGWYCYDDAASLLDDGQVTMLAASPHVSGVTMLNLRCNQIGDAGVRALAESSCLPSLGALDLRANLLGDASVHALVSSSLLHRLQALDLAYNDGYITEAGWQTLANAPDLGQLHSLCLLGNRMSDSTEQTFRRRLGDRVTV
jgi:uncharacterized protein (TIGR02996 family)